MDRPFALLATILANANRNPEQTPEPFTVHDFIHWLSAPFEAVKDTEEDEKQEDWDDTPEENFPFDQAAPALEKEAEPAWKQWKRNIRMYADAVTPATLPPSA